SYGEPSVVRAVVMATLVLLARMLGRRVDLNHIIALTALLILLAAPTQLFDVGFQLSFVTAWGLIFAVPRLMRPFHAHRTRWWYRFLLFPFVVALTAQIVSAPIIAFYFKQVPAFSVIANLLIVPLVSLAVIMEMVLLLAHLIWPLLGLWVGSLLNPLLMLIVHLLGIFGGDRVPMFTVTEWFSRTMLLVVVLTFYLLLFVAILAMTSRRARRVFVFLSLGVANVSLVLMLMLFGPPALHILSRSVPGGVAVLVHTEGKTAGDLVLTGLARKDYSLDERVLTPLLTDHGVRKLDRLIVSAADYGAIDDLLRLAERFHVGQLLIADRLRSSFTDVFRMSSAESALTAPRFYGGRVNAADRDGWYLDSAGIRLYAQGLYLLVRQTPVQETGLARKPANWLVVGRPWR
ncbi:MAG: ComEC/Rec2 family competence protein, partial [Candidatus Zixiibacteriota bacterium]